MNSKIKKIKSNISAQKRRNSLCIIALFLYLLRPLASDALNLISDAEVESGIKRIVSPIIKVTGINPDEMNIYLVLDESVNAFAISGNNIFINTGLLTLFKDVNVLKGVFAHELGHVTGGHIVRGSEDLKKISSNSLITSLLGLAAVLGGSPEAGQAMIFGSMHAANRSMMLYSREKEYSADQAAFKYLEMSGNSPEGLIKIQRYFSTKYVLNNVNPYILTHPLSKERLYAASRLSPWPLDSERNKKDQIIYNRIYAKLRGFIADPKRIIEQKNPKLKGLDRQYELSIAYYRLDDLKKSLSILNRLIKFEPTNGYLYELKGQFLFESGKVKKAASVYKKAVELQKSDVLVKLEYAIALINAATKFQDKKKRDDYNKEAIIQLKAVVRKQPTNSWAFRNLAIAYGRIGKIGASNLMLAEEYLLRRDVERAEKFVAKAKKMGLNKILQVRADDIIKSIADKKKLTKG